MTVIGVIPARLASTRLPGKALLEIAGKPMIQHVYERAKRANLDELFIATDSEKIREAACSFGAQVVMTSPDHPSGTDRLVELSEQIQADFYINIQGDEPLLSPQVIDLLARAWRDNPNRDVYTVANPFCTLEEAQSPHVVKAVLDRFGDALYFSRFPIPFVRNPLPRLHFHKHIGLYGYTPHALGVFGNHKPGPLEQAESLEQLRFMENGMKIRVVTAEYESVGVDTQEDLHRVRLMLKR